VKAAKALMDEILAGPASSGDSESADRTLVRNAKKIALLLLAVAFEKFGVQLDKQQEVLAGVADVVMEVFAMESSLLRLEKTTKPEGQASDMCAVFLRDAMTRIEGFARPVLAACSEGDALRSNMAVLRKFARFQPVDSIALRRTIAGRLIDAGHYLV
jgi:hypothetical protein